VSAIWGSLTMEGKGIPKGGYVFVSATGLLATWWSYKAGLIAFRDVRTWLACHELKARRCTLEKGRLPRFTEAEIGSLIGGVGGEHVRVSLRRLERASLVTWSETAIELRSSMSGLNHEAVEFVEGVTNHRRRIPVPRPLLRFLAGERKPVLVATALGHLLRCMYLRSGRCEPQGLCKASWIADLFGVDERNVKAARQLLERMSVLVRTETPQLVMNRYGVAMRLNLDWPGRTRATTPPRKPQSTTESAPLRQTGISSFRRSGNQKLGEPSPPGVRTRTGRGPSLARVLVVDLKDPSRLLVLERQAQGRGHVGKSESDRLKFFAAAEHALTHGRRNPAGLFAAIVRRGLWHHLSLRDEDLARRALRRACEEGPRERGLSEVPAKVDTWEDPERVRELIACSLGLERLSSDR
jgi:hypothetical protein